METSVTYLKQPSTWRGLVSLAAAIGLFTISQEATDAIVATALQLVAVAESLKGTINIVRNEKK